MDTEEGSLFIATWARTDAGYRVWVMNVRTLAADGATFGEADELLQDVIAHATGDGENLREYSPLAPFAEPTSSGAHALVWLLGVEPSTTLIEPETLFEGGLCPDCLKPRGPRNGTPLAVDRIEARAQASRVVMPKRSPGVGPTLSVYAEEFLALLTSKERDRFEWRPVTLAKRDKRSFFELVPGAPVPEVSIRSRPTYYGRCGTCGWTWVVPDYAKDLPHWYVSAADVGVPLANVFAVGTVARPYLAASEARWAELTGRAGMRGIKGSVGAVVPEPDVERTPTYKTRAPERPAVT